ncbi:type II restriction endonuclease [Gemella sp. zg-1178]|uniref:type II restriction endonuclease n=1 Tax=Gemella sp. zg-1178 TaxID=2840372 RepID=UPI001C05A151|nr:type II restriction endonuclease [Gemella sp. zg-1178]MBU0278460.1 type II restriction endonuclease [Gemella sp. zg-1178]
MDRNFDIWLSKMVNSIASWSWYTDFEKVYKNIDSIKIELNLLNTLINSKNIEVEFKNLVEKYPNILNAIPILIAKRENKIIIKDNKCDYEFNFKKQNYDIKDYILFMRKTGIFNLLENHIISNLYDYVTGIEVGLDSNARKNRTGHLMEDLVESYLLSSGLVKNVNYFKELNKSKIEEYWGIDLSKLGNSGKTEKRFDFVIKTNNKIYAIETNFYSRGGSKLNETARSYKNLFEVCNKIENFEFIWITDGQGWNKAKKNLEETFNITRNIYNINDLENNIILKLIN